MTLKNIFKLGFLIGLILPLFSVFTYNSEHQFPVGKEVKAVNFESKTIKKTDKYYADLLKEEKNIDTDYKYTKKDEKELIHCESLIYKTLKSLPSSHAKQVKKITFMFDENMRRGYGGQTKIRIRCVNVTDEELVSVFTHEVGHLVDTGLKIGSKTSGESAFKDGDYDIYNNDPSIKYYNISWKKTGVSRAGESEENFCSGYGMEQDQFEDFAECYNLYIHQGNLFRAYAEQNDTIKEKYNTLKTTFFNGKEYDKNEKIALKENKKFRYYDTTIISYNLKNFLKI